MKAICIFSITLVSLSLVTIGCERSAGDGKSTTTAPAGARTSTEPDNTARNKGDTEPQNKTPMDQSNANADVRITADIRRAIMEDKTMSTNAQNCKIITDKSGVVTLRGPVDSQTEKDAIESKARAVAGVTRIVNELEVKTK